jgi:hypothetical protein
MPIEILDEPTSAPPSGTFDPVGSCIYCSSNKKLSDEHIIPYGLGGRFVLPKASCDACAKKTSKIERLCLRTMFGDLRASRVIRRRRRGKKNKYVPRPMFAQFCKTLVPYQAPIAHDRLNMATMFALDDPTIISGKSPRNRQFVKAVWVGGSMGKNAPATANTMLNKPVPRIASLMSFHPELFSKMLAKIAHSLAMATARGRFNPLLPQYIVGDTKDHLTGFLVGGDPNQQPPSKTDFEVSLLRTRSIVGVEYLMARIRIFGDLGTPVYYVVVGELLS